MVQRKNRTASEERTEARRLPDSSQVGDGGDSTGARRPGRRTSKFDGGGELLEYSPPAALHPCTLTSLRSRPRVLVPTSHESSSPRRPCLAACRRPVGSFGCRPALLRPPCSARAVPAPRATLAPSPPAMLRPG
jgi:hypothetical protein